LNLRRNKTSTVATLISGIERLARAQSKTTVMTRAFALNELGDAVLAQVAVHALEAYWGETLLRKTRRVSILSDFFTRIIGNRIDSGCSLNQVQLWYRVPPSSRKGRSKMWHHDSGPNWGLLRSDARLDPTDSVCLSDAGPCQQVDG